MPYYGCKIYIPKVIDRILVAPILLLRWIWYGYTFRRIRLHNFKKCAIVDAKDFHEFSKYIWWCWCPDIEAGAVRIVFKKGAVQSVYMHREIKVKNTEYRTQKTEGRGRNTEDRIQNVDSRLRGNDKLVVDHIDRDALNNKRENLRFATRSQNCMNRGKRKKTRSKYKGIHYVKEQKKWRVEIRAYGKRINLGRFSDEIEAAKAYDKAAIQYHKEFACLNFPPRQKPRGLRGIIRNLWYRAMRVNRRSRGT